MTLPATVQQDFERARQPVGPPLVWLHLGADSLWLVREHPDDGTAGASSALSLDLGTHSTARLFFRGDKPTPDELERAIDHVEDELMRAAGWTSGRSRLATGHATVSGLAHGQPVLNRDAVESLFQRLAAASLGKPAAARGLPAGREAAATLLILRELMHHLAFTEVQLRSAQAAPPFAGDALP